MQELNAILQQPDARKHYGVDVSLLELSHDAPEVVKDICSQPTELLPQVSDALVQAQEQLLAQADAESKAGLTIKVSASILQCSSVWQFLRLCCLCGVVALNRLLSSALQHAASPRAISAAQLPQE